MDSTKSNSAFEKSISSNTNTPDFTNLEVAFDQKSNAQLKKAYWLFKSLSFPFFVKLGQKLVSLALLLKIPIKKPIKATLFQQFCGGETIEECELLVERLGNKQVGSILDYSAEGSENEKSYHKCANEVIKTIRKSKKNQFIPFSVFKVTGIGKSEILEKKQLGICLTDQEMDLYLQMNMRLQKICYKAHLMDVSILIDAEESWIQNTIDHFAEQMMAKYNTEKAIVYNTVQMYRHDRLEYLKELHEKSLKEHFIVGVKLVRGAYMEKERERAKLLQKPSPIHSTKKDTDDAYNEALAFCLKNNIHVCISTHNEESCLKTIELMSDLNIPKNSSQVYFSQLLGMSDHISFNLSASGYNVAKYVPFGPVRKVLPYLTRRAQENTSIKGQSTRELDMITSELIRRKKKHNS